MLKGLYEKRAKISTELNGILELAKKEERALSVDEVGKFDNLEKEIKEIDTTIQCEERAKELELKNGKIVPAKSDDDEDKNVAIEERAFENYIRGVVEERADVNLTLADNGAVIPKTIANKIIQKVRDICPIYAMASRYDVKGDLSIPYYDTETTDITMAYATEFNELESTSGKFKSIELKGHLAGVLSLISKSLVNNSQFNIVSFVIGKMAESISFWIEKELLIGTTGKMTGLKAAKQGITAAAVGAVVPDELIDLQETIPDTFQGSAIWIMNKATRTAIRKLKDSEGNYMLNRDLNSKWGYTLLGKDVYTSDNAEKMEAGKAAIYYGDMTGLAVKVSEEAEIEVLREKYATQHAIGVVAWIEMDSKIENEQKLSKLTMKAA